MTQREFWQILRNSTKKFIRFGDGVIVEEQYMYCPIIAVARSKGYNYKCSSYWSPAVDKLRLNRDFAKRVIDAADNEPNHDPLIRKKLLKACKVAAVQLTKEDWE